jgi:hypothetical protein
VSRSPSGLIADSCQTRATRLEAHTDLALLYDECNGDLLDAMRIGGKEGKLM